MGTPQASFFLQTLLACRNRLAVSSAEGAVLAATHATAPARWCCGGRVQRGHVVCSCALCPPTAVARRSPAVSEASLWRPARTRHTVCPNRRDGDGASEGRLPLQITAISSCEGGAGPAGAGGGSGENVAHCAEPPAPCGGPELPHSACPTAANPIPVSALAGSSSCQRPRAHVIVRFRPRCQCRFAFRRAHTGNNARLDGKMADSHASQRFRAWAYAIGIIVLLRLACTRFRSPSPRSYRRASCGCVVRQRAHTNRMPIYTVWGCGAGYT